MHRIDRDVPRICDILEEGEGSEMYEKLTLKRDENGEINGDVVLDLASFYEKVMFKNGMKHGPYEIIYRHFNGKVTGTYKNNELHGDVIYTFVPWYNVIKTYNQGICIYSKKIIEEYDKRSTTIIRFSKLREQEIIDTTTNTIIEKYRLDDDGNYTGHRVINRPYFSIKNLYYLRCMGDSNYPINDETFEENFERIVTYKAHELFSLLEENKSFVYRMKTIYFALPPELKIEILKWLLIFCSQ